ncbi:MAG: hypothetical protein H0S80_01970 [Desulfovibrionaceae bacterium]|nr:hypothetical protein [Desulfovibrionaceae bacterium]
MQKNACDFPEWINEFAVADERFAHAYETVPGHRRALLKTAIARLFEWYGPSRTTARRLAEEWRGGFASVQDTVPADYAVVVFDASLVSPARLLAAVVPALSCGVENVLAVRLGTGEWSAPVLAGLELAGQELVAEMDADRLKGLFEELDASGAKGAVLGLELPQGVFRALRFPTRRIAFTCLRCDRSVPVWMDPEEPFDLEALAFSHPDLDFAVHGAEAALPAGFSRGGKDFQGFLDSIREVACAPASRVGEALDRARLVLGPGQEGCWVWPQLRPGHFHYHSTAWIIGA